MAVEVRYYTDEDGWSEWVPAGGSSEATAAAGLLSRPGDRVTVRHADDHPAKGLAGVTAEYRMPLSSPAPTPAAAIGLQGKLTVQAPGQRNLCR